MTSWGGMAAYNCAGQLIGIKDLHIKKPEAQMYALNRQRLSVAQVW